MPDRIRRPTFDPNLRPVRVKDLEPVYEDEEEYERRNKDAERRKNYKLTRQQQMSFNQEGEAIASYRPLFERAEAYLKRESQKSLRGRPRERTAYDHFFFHYFRKLYPSEHKTANEVKDLDNWQRFKRAAELAFPDNPEWRLSKLPPSRTQFRTFMGRHILGNSEELEHLEDDCLDAAIDAALHIGLLDKAKGSFTKPDKTRTAYGDLGFFKGRYNASREQAVDKETGEILRRFDPDGHSHTGNNKKDRGSPGHTVCYVGIRNGYPNERVPLILTTKPPDVSEGEYIVEQVTKLLTRYPEMRGGMLGFAYDMGLKPVHVQQLYELGVIPFIKLSLTNTSKVPTFRLRDQEFTQLDGTTTVRDVHFVDGPPCVTFIDGEGDHCYQPLRCIKRSRIKNKTATSEELPSYRWYGMWEVPENPLLEQLVGAKVRIRPDSPLDEIEGNAGKRTNAHRVCPPSDPYFGEVFGVREDAESLFANLKTPLLHRRLPCVGRNRVRADLLGSQGIAVIRALIAWHERTGGDVSPFFGQRCPLPRDAPHDCP